jgi:hypothetical protein
MINWLEGIKYDSAPAVATLKPYYQGLISRYFPDEVSWYRHRLRYLVDYWLPTSSFGTCHYTSTMSNIL